MCPNLLVIEDLGSIEIPVMLMHSHTDLQSLQAPCLTVIVIQAFPFFFFFAICIYLVIQPAVLVGFSRSGRDSWGLRVSQTQYRLTLRARVLTMLLFHPRQSIEWHQG